MDQNQQELRHAAAKAFMESLKQLQETLQPLPDAPDTTVAPVGAESITERVKDEREKEHPSELPPFDLTLFAQAAADIEQFLEGEE